MKRWQITWGGEVFREGDLTVGEAKKVVDLAGEDWFKINPYRSPEHLTAIIAVFAARKSVDTAVTQAQVDGMRLDEVLECISTYDDVEDLPEAYEDGLPK